MYGLVSTGTKFPHTILKRIFTNQKKIVNYFIHIFNAAVEKDEVKTMPVKTNILKQHHKKIYLTKNKNDTTLYLQ